VAKARNSVVRIESTKRTASGTEQDVGSGVVLDGQGHILTNAHVVLNTDSLTVVLADGSERRAILLGHDLPFTDMAVIQVGPGGLTPIDVGDSSQLVLGQTAIAIGNPLASFDGSVTVGAISGLDRQRKFDTVLQKDLIQTDAALNEGNSGGALINLEGQFIGMPTAVLRQSQTGSSVEGIAFALPANRVIPIARRIVVDGASYPRPSLGLDHVDLTPEALSRLPRVAVEQGALVTQIDPDGPGGRGGIRAGDVITQVGDQAIDEQTPLLNALMAHQPGDAVRFVLNRNDRIIEVEVRLGKRA
jgi:S1-C subfamily serine protease